MDDFKYGRKQSFVRLYARRDMFDLKFSKIIVVNPQILQEAIGGSKVFRSE